MEIGDVVAVVRRPLRDGLGALGAVEVDDQFLTGLQGRQHILGLDEREGAHRTHLVEGVAALGRIEQVRGDHGVERQVVDLNGVGQERPQQGLGVVSHQAPAVGTHQLA